MVGQITHNSGVLGGWTLVNDFALPITERDENGEIKTVSRLPQDVASGIGIVGEANGADYTPLFYVGTQVVNGTNHWLVSRKKKDGVESIVNLIFNIPIGSIGGVGATLVKEETTDDVTFSDEANEALHFIQTNVFPSFTVKPLVEIGTQIVKGTNYHLVVLKYYGSNEASTQVSYEIANKFQGKWTFEADVCLG